MATKYRSIYERRIREDNETGRKRDAEIMARINEEGHRNGIRDARRNRIRSRRFTTGETAEQRRRRLYSI